MVDLAETIDVTRDPGMARAVRLMLEEVVREDADPIRQEIAREVLGGRMRMSEICSYGAYREALEEGMDDLVARHDSLSARELDERAAEGLRHLAAILAEAERERSGGRR